MITLENANVGSEADERRFLRNGDVLLLYSEGGEAISYRIESVLGAGASAVCYAAVRERDGKAGKLKEFYPRDMEADTRQWYYSLERTTKGQLVPRGGTIRQFHDLCEQYLENYRRFNHLVAENPQNEILKNYIQDYEILYGKVTEEKNAWNRFFARFQPDPEPVSDDATVYVWTSGIAGENYDSYLNQVRQSPQINPDRRLYEILQTMTVLTDSIAAMHRAGLLHLDIKPSNFLVGYNSSHDIDPSRISMFDIDSIYRVDDPFPKITGTEGYRAPEVMRGKADNRSDIYSIGALLFKAVVIDEKLGKEGIYQDSYYEHIDRYLRNSVLITGSTAGQNPGLVAVLSWILQKCLAPVPKKRYQNCPSLMEDLRKALSFCTLPVVGSQIVGDNQKLAVIPKNEQGIVSPVLAIQKLLHDHPLYSGLKPQEKAVNILVLGSGTYGQHFMDLCLQVAQMPGYVCNIFSVSDQATQFRNEYLSARPAMERFVSIDGSFADPLDEAYGSLHFISYSDAAGQEDAGDSRFLKGNGINENAFNASLAGRILSHLRTSGYPVSYIFIALGFDSLNRSVAAAFSKWKGEGVLEEPVPIAYVSETDQEALRKKPSSEIVLPIMEPITWESIDPQLLQMAFNTHLSWISSRNIDVEKTYQEFLRSRYDLNASVEYALSIQYKLYGIGIRIRSEENEEMPVSEGFCLARDYTDAALCFDRTVLSRRKYSPEAQKTFDELVAFEHRRWVVSMIAKGWNAPLDQAGNLDLNRCVSAGKVRNEVDFTHPCMVRSREGNPLSGAEYQKDNHARWEAVPIDPSLDELDQMSLGLHQAFQAEADRYRKQDPLYMGEIKALDALISPYGDRVRLVFNEFRFCLKNILEEVESYSRQYRYYEDELSRALKGLPIEDKAAEKLRQIRREFFPVIEANLFRNYKENDVILLENTPLIMTYRSVGIMVVPFEDARTIAAKNEAVFSNVASATMLSPSRILYLYRFTNDSEITNLIEKLSHVLNYLDRREVHCDIAFVIGIQDRLWSKVQDQLEAALHYLAETSSKNTYSSLKKFRVMSYADSVEEETAFAKLLADAKKDGLDLLFDASHGLFPTNQENEQFSAALRKMRINSFGFDPRTKKFSTSEGCSYLKYVKNHSCLRVNDIFTLLGSKDGAASIPEYFQDYEPLWNIYCGNYTEGKPVSAREGMEAWNTLAKTLAKYFSENDTLTTFSVADRNKSSNLVHHTFYLPEMTFTTMSDIIDALKRENMCEKDSMVEHYTSQEMKISLHIREGLLQSFFTLVKKADKLLPYYGIKVKKEKNSDISIKADSLFVHDLSLTEIKSSSVLQNILSILKTLRSEYYLRNLQIEPKKDPNKVSFLICSPRIRKVLTQEGMLLEVYTYYQALKTGYFDDVACNYRFSYGDGRLVNELDVILTKGFRTIIMECKGKTEVNVDTIYKLDSIVCQIGIAPVKVLVTKDRSAMKGGTAERGKLLQVITVSDEEISKIGEILIKKLEAMA